jgi:hypothetical protein
MLRRDKRGGKLDPDHVMVMPQAACQPACSAQALNSNWPLGPV